MLFEKQKYQEDCVKNISNTLKNGVDFYNQDYTKLQNSIKKLEINNSSFPFSKKKRLDILMETGTGKTFTYIKTIFELNKRFNRKKFIIVVPRSAIRLGVIQNINLTKEYFFNEYNKYLNIIDYPKDGISKIKNDFIRSEDISVMILNYQSFNSEKNNINKQAEDLYHNGSILENIAKKNPIVFIDEPHLLKGSKTVDYLEKLDTLFIRFGATYPKDEEHKLSNVVYSLDSISSFNKFLVKKIRVNTVFRDDEIGGFKLSKIEASKKSFFISYFINEINYTKKVKLKEDIGAKTGLARYNGVEATKINKNDVYLSNKEILKTNVNYSLGDEETRLMIRTTIKKHFEKEEGLFNKNIKTLSLFFIPSIADFKGDNPRIKKMFEEEYRIIHKEKYSNTKNKKYKDFLGKDYVDGELLVHNGYFSGSKGTADQKESKAVEIILERKEELLSFNTNLRFIFSVWALQEGWDNPNVFNICKLSNTSKEISRRQQVGRGLRIAVNQKGRRLTYKYLDENENNFYKINTLDMIVSSKEQDFIEKIQNEINEASFSIAGAVLSVEILKEKGITEREASCLILIFV